MPSNPKPIGLTKPVPTPPPPPRNDDTKLPKWAQEKLQRLASERDAAVTALASYVDKQATSPIYTEDLICDGRSVGPTFTRRYIHGAYTIVFKHAGVKLYVSIHDKDHIDLKWNAQRRVTGEVSLVPYGYQQLRLYQGRH